MSTYRAKGCQPARKIEVTDEAGYDECDCAPPSSSGIPKNFNSDDKTVCVSTDEGIYSFPEGHISSCTSTNSVPQPGVNAASATTVVLVQPHHDEPDDGLGPSTSITGSERDEMLAQSLGYSRDIVSPPQPTITTTDPVDVVTNSIERIVVEDKAEANYKLLYTEDEDGDTQLHLVIIHKCMERAVQFLSYARSQRDINIQNHLRQSPLHLAVLTRQPKLVQHLIRWGAKLDMRDRFGNTPLHLACKYGYVDCVWLLMATPGHKPCDSIPPPPFEVEPQTIRSDISWTNYEGETCLHLAAGNMHIDVLQVLTNSFHVDINVTELKVGRTILHQAVELEQVDMVKYLASNNLGVAIGARTYGGLTAIELLASREPTDKRIEMVRILLAAGAAPPSDVSDDDSDSGDEMDIDNIDDFEFAGQRML